MVFDFGIQIKNKTQYYALVCGITLVINLLANYFGIKYWGPSTAPVIKLVTYTLYLAMILFISQRLYKVTFEKRTILVVLASALMVFLYLTYAIEAVFVVRLGVMIGYSVFIAALFVNRGEKQKVKSFI